MTTIVTRTSKGSALSWTEADANFTNLNTDKAETSALAATDAALAAHLADSTDAHDASAISNVPAGNIVATDVQAAIDELDAEKVPETDFSAFGKTIVDDADRSALKTTIGLQVDGLTALQALTPGDEEVIYLTYRSSLGDGGEGTFIWDSSNLSAAVTVDTQKGVYVPPSSDTSGASGAWVRQYADVVSVLWFGAVGNGSTDDTTAIQEAIDYIVYSGGGVLLLPVGTYKTTSQITHNSSAALIIRGEGYFGSSLTTSTNFAAILSLGASSVNTIIENVAFVQTGTTTECINVAVGASGYTLKSCRFKGNGAGVSLVNSNGQNPEIYTCSFVADSGTTLGLEIDGYNQNGRVIGNRFGGIGKGINITNSHGASNDAEGVLMSSNVFINTGSYNIQVGDSFLTQIHDNICDQASTTSINLLTGADRVSILNNWIALAVGNTTGTCVNVEADAGNKIKINNNIMSEGAKGVVIKATVSDRADGVDICYNSFNNNATVAVQLDSVLACKVVGNDDAGSPTNGSWTTAATFGNGEYWFDKNSWHTTAPALFHTGSTYHWGEDSGIVGRVNGYHTVGAAATSAAISHGLFRVPSKVFATPAQANPGTFNTQGYTSTQFTIAWATSGTPSWSWEAEV